MRARKEWKGEGKREESRGNGTFKKRRDVMRRDSHLMRSCIVLTVSRLKALHKLLSTESQTHTHTHPNTRWRVNLLHPHFISKLF